MSSISIREATSNDANAISELLQELGYPLSPSETAARIDCYQKISSSVLVADNMDKTVGFLSFHFTPLFHTSGNLGRITAMCVSKKCQRIGIGRALLEELDGIAIKGNCQRIEVISGDQRSRDAHLFYQTCGYAMESRRFLKHLHHQLLY